MRDGLYRVVGVSFCAGFVVRDGVVIACAPFLRRGISVWLRRANWVCS